MTKEMELSHCASENHAHHHGHGHHHGHHHHHEVKNIDGVFILALVINIVFVAVEFAAGYFSNSLGLVSDAGHNLSDVLGLVLAMVAFYLKKRGTANCARVSNWVTVANSLLLVLAVVIIIYEAIEKIMNPETIDSQTMIIVAAAAIVINGLTAYMLNRGAEDDINIRAAYLHAFTDTLVSVGVVAGGVVILLTGYSIVDPIISLVISAIIGVPVMRLMMESIHQLRHGEGEC